MSSSLNLMESAAQDRHAERYRRAHRGYASKAAPDRTGAEVRVFETARRRAGWLLVGLGLRLISSGRSGGEAPARRGRLIGQ